MTFGQYFKFLAWLVPSVQLNVVSINKMLIFNAERNTAKVCLQQTVSKHTVAQLKKKKKKEEKTLWIHVNFMLHFRDLTLSEQV